MIADDYLGRRAGDAPSGDDLEYDPAFMDLMVVAQPGQDRQAGSEIVPGAEPDWKSVSKKALAVLERSHDLRAAAVLAQAQVKLEGFEGLAPVLAYVRGCLEMWWESCHPQLDAEDDNDPTMRINAVMALSSTSGGFSEQDVFLRLVRQAPLTESRTFGRMSLRDVAVASGEMAAAPGTPAPDAASVAAAFKETPAEVLKARLDAARAALADVRAINAVFDAQTPGNGPDLDPLERILRKAVVRLAEAVGEPEVAVADAPGDETAEVVAAYGGATPARAAASVPGTISSQADVAAALDRIMAYYASQEPSSPIPLLLGRAKRLVGADFLTIMTDIVPEGTDTVRGLAGIRDTTEE